MFSTVAFAQAAGAAAKPSVIEQFMPFIFIFIIFYIFLIRPQQKKAKVHQDFVGALKKGDSILTNGGILGTIEGLTDQFVTLEVSDGVRLRVLRSQISSPLKSVVEEKPSAAVSKKNKK